MSTPSTQDTRSTQGTARSEGADIRSAGEPVTEQAWLIVARREVMSKLTDRAFLIGTLFTLVLIVGVMGFQAYMEQRGSTHKVAVTAAAGPMGQAVKAGAVAADDNTVITLVEAADDAAATQAVTDGNADAWLHQVDGTWTLTGKDGVDSGLRSLTADVVRDEVQTANAAAAGTDVQALNRGATLAVAQLQGDARKSQFGQVLGFALAFLFYLASLGFGMTLAGSVVEEKASRIVEIITTKIPVRHLLIGKILGNTALALGQMIIFAGVGLVGLSFTPYASFLPSASAVIGWFLAFFLFGFLLISCLWAVAGALASRTEDLQQSAMPLTMLMMGMFFGSFLLKGTWLTIASFVPPLSAILMPVRLAQGSAAWWEALVALGLLVVAAGVIVRFAERLYRRSLLQTQGRISLKQAWTAAE